MQEQSTSSMNKMISFLRQNALALFVTFLSLTIFVLSVYPDLRPEGISKPIYVEYSEGYPVGGSGNILLYNMTDDSLSISIPNYEPPTSWNQTLPPLFAYFYIGLPFPILKATCTGGSSSSSSQCDSIFVSQPFDLGNYWWIATNQTWRLPFLFLRLSVSGSLNTDLWTEKDLRFSLGGWLDFPGFSFQNQTYILKNVFHTSKPYFQLGLSGRDVYRNPFSMFSAFVTPFYFGVIPSAQIKEISPLPLVVLGNGQITWDVLGKGTDPFYGQDKLFVVSTRNPWRDVASSFSGIAFGSALGLLLQFHRKGRGTLEGDLAERGLPSPPTIWKPSLKEETEIQIIRVIDREFAQSKQGVLLLWGAIGLIGGAAGGFALVGSFIVAIAIIASVAQSPQWINLLGLGTAIMALGVSAGALILTTDWEPRFQRARYSFHLNNLKRSSNEINPITLDALVKMRNVLPRGITLERVYTANRELFSEKEFARRLAE